MTGLRIFRIWGLVAVLLFVSSGTSQGAISLRVDGADVTSVILAPGQSCTIEIYSTNGIEYVAYVGFQAADPLGTFDYLYTYPQAGTFAMVNPYNEPPFTLAYEAVAMGGPSPGMHFAFQYTAATPGQVELVLWRFDTQKDSVLITVQEQQGTGACCYPTGGCSMTDEQHCSGIWMGAGTDCAICPPPQEFGACCNQGTGECYISEPGNCPYTWLGTGTDCTSCHGQPTQGACCNQNTGSCFITDVGSCPPPNTWLGAGTGCSSCTPLVEVKRFEINQCFQEVEADGVTQKYALIETKPFVARVTLKAITPGTKNANVRLKVEGIGEKDPNQPTPIIIDPCATCDFFFNDDNDTKNMKAGTYKFSLFDIYSGAEIWSHNYPFKSSKTVRFIAVQKTDINGVTVSWDDRYITFAEQVFPVPKTGRTNVNHLEIVRWPSLQSGGSFDWAYLGMNLLLKLYNNDPKHKGKQADFICAVVPAGFMNPDWLGVTVDSNVIFILPRTRNPAVEYTLAHEIGHVYELGEEYVNSEGRNDGLHILDQTFRFDLNPPPLEINPNGPFYIVREPNLGQRCDWDPDQSSYAPHQVRVGMCCNGRYVVPDKAGYKVKDKREVRFYPTRPADNTLTMMSAGGSQKWISGREYKSLITELAPPAGAASLPATAASPASGERMLVSGIMDIPAKTAEFSPLIPVPNLELSREVSEPNCQLVFKSDTGAVLADFNLAPLESELPGSQLKGPFSVIVDLPVDTARIQVIIEGVVADELQLTDNSPTVTVLSPNGGEEISGEMVITWSASDADINDANNLRYIVEFSHDNGAEWSALVINHNDDELTVDSNYLPGGLDCLVKVIASDGWNRSEDTSNFSFTIATKPPEVTILYPEDGTILLDSESMHGRCTAYDPETGDINDPNAIVWSSSIDGLLGKGDLIGFQLSVGEHILSATATDSEAKTGIDTVSVKVLANASDFNCNNHVDFLDLAKFAEKWQETCLPPNWCEGTDIDRNSIVDYDDLAELVENWLWQAQP